MKARLCAVFVLLALVIAPRIALASEAMTVTLQLVDSAPPAFACIAVPVAGASAMNAKALNRAVSIAPNGLLAGLRVQDDTKKRAFFSPPPAAQAEPRWSAFETTRLAAAALAAFDDEKELCGGPWSPCRAEFPAELAPEQKPQGNAPKFLLCARNRHEVAGTSVTPSVALLRLDFERPEAPPASEIELIGNIAVVTFDTPFTAFQPVVSVLGGHYLPQAKESVVGNRVTVPLAGRCSKRILELPATPIGEKTIAQTTVKRDQDAICALDLPLKGRTRLPVTIPASATQASATPTTMSVNVKLVTDARSTSSLGTTWTEERPPAPVVLRFRSVALQWRRHCLYVGTEGQLCPEDVTLPDSGATCSLTQNAENVCHYNCEASATSFNLPAKVHFEVGEDTWNDVLRTPNERLDGFVDPDERRLGLSFEKWEQQFDGLARQSWETIESIEVRGPGGATYRVRIPNDNEIKQQAKNKEGKPGSSQHVTRMRIPGLSCEDHVSYRYVGDRPYRERTEKVNAGIVKLAEPADLVDDLLRFGVALGGGAYSPWFSTPIRPSASIDGIVILHPLPTQRTWWPKTWLLRPWFEFRAGFVLSSKWYFGVPASHIAFAEDEELYDRFVFLVSPAWPLPQNLYFAPSVGAMFGTPFKRDERRVEQDLSFLWGLLVGYRPDHGVLGVEAGFRVALNEQHRAFATDYRSDAFDSTISKSALFADIRIRFGW